MGEPRMIDVGKYAKAMLPGELRDRCLALGVPEEKLDKPIVQLTTRDRAREIIEDRPECVGSATVYLNAAPVEIATPTFFDEMLKSMPGLQLAGANEEVQECFDLAHSKMPAASEEGDRDE